MAEALAGWPTFPVRIVFRRQIAAPLANGQFRTGASRFGCSRSHGLLFPSVYEFDPAPAPAAAPDGKALERRESTRCPAFRRVGC